MRGLKRPLMAGCGRLPPPDVRSDNERRRRRASGCHVTYTCCVCSDRRTQACAVAAARRVTLVEITFDRSRAIQGALTGIVAPLNHNRQHRATLYVTLTTPGK